MGRDNLKKSLITYGFFGVVLILAILLTFNFHLKLVNLFSGGSFQDKLIGGLDESRLVASLFIENEPSVIVAVEGFLDDDAPILNEDLNVSDTDDESLHTTITEAFYLIAYDPAGAFYLPLQNKDIIVEGYIKKDFNTYYQYTDDAHTKRNFPVDTNFSINDTCVVDSNILLDVDGEGKIDLGLNGYEGYELGDIGRRYICRVKMFYYDDPDNGDPNDFWDVVLTEFKDFAPEEYRLTAQNIIDAPLGELKFIDVFAPQSNSAIKAVVANLTFTGIDVDDPFTWNLGDSLIDIVNSGNIGFGDINEDSLRLKGNSLLGVRDESSFIGADNFKFYYNSEECINLGTNLIEDTFLNLNDFIIRQGDHISNIESNKELYFCLYDLPSSLKSQNYETKYNPSLGIDDRWVIGF